MANQSASQSSELSRILLDVLFCNADKRLFSQRLAGSVIKLMKIKHAY